jgi:hypothetical protein
MKQLVYSIDWIWIPLRCSQYPDIKRRTAGYYWKGTKFGRKESGVLYHQLPWGKSHTQRKNPEDSRWPTKEPNRQPLEYKSATTLIWQHVRSSDGEWVLLSSRVAAVSTNEVIEHQTVERMIMKCVQQGNGKEAFLRYFRKIILAFIMNV